MKSLSHALLATALLLLACLLAAAAPAGAQSRIPFNNQQVFLDGSNIAWVNFAGDLGPNPLDTVAFRTVFDSIHAHGGNALRFWLHTTGANTPQFNAGGAVIGPGSHAIADLKLILDMAWQRKIGLLLSLWSFDMMNIANGSLVTNRSQLMLTDTTYTRYYINNALIPMVQGVSGHPAIIGWEIFNEAEGMSNEFGWSTTYHVPMADIQAFVNLCAGAIHRTDPSARVTTGAWALTALTDVNGLAKSTDVQSRLRTLSAAEKSRIEDEFFARYQFRMTAEDLITKFAAGPNYNYYRDDRLMQTGGDPQGALDFYTDHYYDWQSTPISPFVHPASTWALTKPLVIAEFFPEATLGLPYTSLYDTLYANGYAGALSWGWYSGSSGHPQATLQANTLVLTQELFSRYPDQIDPAPVSGTVYSFTATPALMDSGQVSVIDWKTALGTTATVNGAPVAIRGTMNVSPAATTPYTLIARGSIADTSRVSVAIYPSGKIISFRASPMSIGIGDPVRLHWSAAHSSVVTLNDSSVARNDSAVVHPLKTTTYRLISAGSLHDTSSIVITAVPQDQIDRARSRPIDVSSTSGTTGLTNPQSLVDGDTSTQWGTAPLDSQWLICDLGQNFLVKRVIIHWGSNYATAWRLALSPDNITSTQVRSTTSGPGGTTVIDSINTNGQFVSLSLDIRASSSSGFIIREFEVYGSPQPLSSAGPEPGVPDHFALYPNYPNPFNPSTTISFALPVESQVTISIYNLLGQRVAELLNDRRQRGYHTVQWNAGAASGAYFCRMEATGSGAAGGRFLQTMKLMVLR
jgi:hypothetical protein